MRQLLPAYLPDVLPGDFVADTPASAASASAWVGLCMIASIDGATAVDGRSGGLACRADTAMLLALRRRADVVLVGAATVRAEGYGPPSKPGLRIGVVSSRGAGLDYSSPLFASGAGFVVTTTDAPSVPVPSIRAGTNGSVDLTTAISELGAAIVQVEGGARLNAALLAADLIDEVSLTISPQLVGGVSSRLTVGAPERLSRFDLDRLAEDDGFLFARYTRRPRLSTGVTAGQS